METAAKTQVFSPRVALALVAIGALSLLCFVVFAAYAPEAGGEYDGRPNALYITSKVGESCTRVASASSLMRRSGWPFGTRCSGSITTSIARCRRSSPRIRHFLHHLGYSLRRITTKRNSRVYQHPAREVAPT